MYAGKILAEHNVPVAYKSDHVQELTSAKYLLFQAAIAHSFGLPEIKALQSVTSVPAKSLEQDHRIGYARAGYDADLVVWDSHPLSVGATPLQVFVDGRATLDEKAVKASMANVNLEDAQTPPQPRIRPLMDEKTKAGICAALTQTDSTLVITGIRKSYTDFDTKGKNMTMIIKNGTVIYSGTIDDCPIDNEGSTFINLNNGYALPGLTVVSQALGLEEIEGEKSTSDGPVSTKLDPTNPDSVVYAKYGIHLEGRAFKRAQIGGVTRSVTTPLMRGFLGGVSVGIKTSEKNTLLDGGIFQSDVGLHFVIGQNAKGLPPSSMQQRAC